MRGRLGGGDKDGLASTWRPSSTCRTTSLATSRPEDARWKSAPRCRPVQGQSAGHGCSALASVPEASKPVASSADKPRHRRQKRLLRSASRYATAYGRDADLSHAPSAPALRLDFLSLTITVGGAWHPARSSYLFPVRARSRHFRGGFVSGLRRACEAGQLSRLRNRAEVDRSSRP